MAISRSVSSEELKVTIQQVDCAAEALKFIHAVAKYAHSTRISY